MCVLISDIHSRPKINTQSVKDPSRNYIGNTIEYDMKSYQVKMTIVNFTRFGIKLLKFYRSQKNMLV